MKKIAILLICFAFSVVHAQTKIKGPQPFPDYKRDVTAANGVVSVSNSQASQIGVDILKKGGNAFDAAIATAFAINVTEPMASGLGGGGFAILYVAKEKKVYVIDFREMAPAKAVPDFYVDKEGKKVKSMTIGWNGAAIPGQVAGMEELHKKFGTKKWNELLDPSIKLLENGVEINAHVAIAIMDALGRFDQSPTKEFFHKTFLKDGLPLTEGEKYFNPDLVWSLKQVAKGGSKAFYTGAIADKIAAAYSKNAENWITKQDLAAYKVKMREPIVNTYRKDYKIYALPAPSSGGITMLEILNIVEKYDLKKLGFGNPDSMHLVIEAQKLSFADRGEYLGDPDFVKVPTAELINKEFAAKRAALIDMKKAIEKAEPGVIKRESGNTTSLSVIDKDGNMITITQTINDYFGSTVVPDGTGIIMNDEMDDFNSAPGQANSVAPGKRPRSSMAPIIVFKNNKPFMTIGTPGGSRIMTMVTNVLINMIDYGMNIQDAIAAPRFHSGNNGKTEIEIGSEWPEKTIKTLTERGQIFSNIGYYGGIHGIVILPDGKKHGGADTRRMGKAIGY